MTEDRQILESRINSLYEMILKLETVDDCRALFSDLCTYKEVEQMAQRAYGAKLFLEGKTYAKIIAETDLSSATLSRISRSLSYGSGGYRKFIQVENSQEGDQDED